jgi:UDP-glucose 4-epimerase
MNVLVTGGAGYIGSFMTKALLDKGYKVIVFDSLERGHKEAVDARAIFIQGDIKDMVALDTLFGQNQIDAVMHFAGYISVEESTKNPEVYFQNNIVGSKNLFNAAIAHGVKKIIFSSSAAVYGNPTMVPIPEDHPKNPTSPYGQNKLDAEKILADLCSENTDLGFASLRYFNAAGASLDGSLGENHNPETHIIPLAIRAIIESKEFNLYGTDYDTQDGTCIRDYIHVVDLVDAHILALEKLGESGGEHYYNVGTGNGYSNREVINAIEEVSGKKINIIEREKRAGDADKLIADPTRIQTELGFVPQYSDLQTIVKTAWNYYSKK